MIATALRLAIAVAALALATTAEAGIRRYGTFPPAEQATEQPAPPAGPGGGVAAPGAEPPAR
jgi:hypothetical protein